MQDQTGSRICARSSDNPHELDKKCHKQRPRRCKVQLAGIRFLKDFYVSAVTGAGIVHLADEVLANLRGKDVFVVGTANVGKTTLVQKLASTIAGAVYMKGKSGQRQRDVAANLDVTASHLPGTTLQAIRIPCFSSPGHALWDTPGIINSKALQYSLFPAHLMEPLSRGIQPIPVPTKENGLMFSVRKGMSILVEAKWMETNDDDSNDDDYHGEDNGNKEALGPAAVLGRIDIDDISDNQSLFVNAYIHPELRLRVVPTANAPDRATIPSNFCQLVQKRMNRKVPERVYSLPLKPFVTERDRPGGEFIAGEKQLMNNGKYSVDFGMVEFSSRTEIHADPTLWGGIGFQQTSIVVPIQSRSVVVRPQRRHTRTRRFRRS